MDRQPGKRRCRGRAAARASSGSWVTARNLKQEWGTSAVGGLAWGHMACWPELVEGAKVAAVGIPAPANGPQPGASSNCCQKSDICIPSMSPLLRLSSPNLQAGRDYGCQLFHPPYFTERN